MGEESVDVKVRLILDNKASAEAAKVKTDFKETGHATEEAGHSASGFAATASKGWMAVAAAAAVASAAVIIAAKSMIGGGMDLVHESIERALDALGEEASIRQGLSMMDGGVHTMAQLSGSAHELHDRFEDLGIQAGVSSESMMEAFTDIASRTSKSSDKVAELVENMARAGRVVPGGIHAMSEGFAAMELGMIKAKNPIVALISQTGLLKGNAHDVAKQLQAMSPEKAMELGEKAIDKFAKTVDLSKVPLKGMVSSLKDIKDNAMEAMGHPIVAGLTPLLGDIRTFFIAHREQIEAVMTDIGHQVAKVFDVARTVWAAIIQGFNNKGEDFHAAMKDIFTFVKSVFQFISDHKDDIAKVVRNVIEGSITVLKVLIDTLKTMWGNMKELAKSGMLGEGVQNYAKKSEQEDIKKNYLATIKNSPGHQEGMASQTMFATKMQRAGADDSAVTAALAEAQTLQNAINGVAKELDMAGQTWRVDEWARLYNEAGKSQNVALQQYAADVLTGSSQLQQALLNSTVTLDGGFDALADLLKARAPEFAKLVGAMGAPTVGGTSPRGPSINMSGGQTFNLKQDFRDQDPDRVAVVFRRDIAKSAEQRVQSRVSTPFGL